MAKKRMNVVFIMTDTQAKHMVGCYGDKTVDTPNIDAFAATGVRFDNAYSSSPLCTPARGAIFSGQAPQVNGAWTNNVSPHAAIPLMGTIFSYYGYKTAYSGKWHLDGTGYFGDGQPGGGFMPDWWYDGKRYADDLGPARFKQYREVHSLADIRAANFTEEECWGYRVASKAINFLETVGDDPFVLAVSFDEPHHPSVAPPHYWEQFAGEGKIGRRPNYYAPLADNKPRMQHVQRAQQDPSQVYLSPVEGLYGGNAFVDRQVGRVIEAVTRLHGEDTLIIYTSDHGDMLGSHGLWYKGPQMYQETINIPFIARLPGGASSAVSPALVTHLDIIPTMLDLAGIPIPASMHGRSFLPALKNPELRAHEYVMSSFHRFSINFDIFGSFYPIRCATGERYKLSLNLLDTDELYDLQNDPYELVNLIDHPVHADVRDRMHDWLLLEMNRIRDPYRTYQWGKRSWRTVQDMYYLKQPLAIQNLPTGFPFQAECIHANGEYTNKGGPHRMDELAR